jgi:O-methyltransferase
MGVCWKMNGDTVEQSKHPRASHAASMYLDVLKRSLVNWYYGHTAVRAMRLFSLKRKFIAHVLERSGYMAVEPAPLPLDQLTDGRGTYCDASYTLVGLKRLENVEFCVRTVLDEGVPGDLLEAGVWAGGTCIFMKGILALYEDRERSVWVADSFEGLPPPNPELYPQDADDYLHTVNELAVSLDTVRDNFRRFDLLDERVRFLKGYFKDTLHKAPIDELAVLRMDGDMYESTMDTLVALYPKLSVGGFLIIDDYLRPNCAQAVKDYRERYDLTEQIDEIDWTGAYWRKEKAVGNMTTHYGLESNLITE